MRSIAFAVLAIGLAASAAQAQSDEEKYQEKLKKEFVQKAPWVMKLDDALARAREQKKLIIGYFTRSYSP